jgi:hypothetical protein
MYLVITLLSTHFLSQVNGNGVYFLIVKISLNSQGFSRKTNHEGEEGAQRMHETVLYSFLLRLCVLEPKVRWWLKILQYFDVF